MWLGTNNIPTTQFAARTVLVVMFVTVTDFISSLLFESAISIFPITRLEFTTAVLFSFPFEVMTVLIFGSLFKGTMDVIPKTTLFEVATVMVPLPFLMLREPWIQCLRGDFTFLKNSTASKPCGQRMSPYSRGNCDDLRSHLFWALAHL